MYIKWLESYDDVKVPLLGRKDTIDDVIFRDFSIELEGSTLQVVLSTSYRKIPLLSTTYGTQLEPKSLIFFPLVTVKPLTYLIKQNLPYEAKIKNKFVSCSTRIFTFLSQITAFTFFI